MKICPYCQQKLPDNLLKCNYCRKVYPKNINIVRPIKNIEGDYPVWTLNESFVFLAIMCIMLFVFSFIISVIYEVYYTTGKLSSFLNNPLYSALPGVITQILMVGSVYVMLKKRYKLDFGKALKLIAPKKFNIYIFTFLLVALIFNGFIVMKSMPEKGIKISQISFLYIYSFIVLTVIIAPFCEEICFRGFFYPAINRRWGMHRAILITSALFAIIHFNYLHYFPALFQIFLLGLAITYLRATTQSTFIAVIFHFLYNLSVAIFYLSTQDLYWMII